jgi:hypothetical protein
MAWIARRHLRDDREGFIGTLNLAIISLTIAAAMAGCIFGVSAIFVRMGRIEIESTYVTRINGAFIISMKVRNVGGMEATIDKAYLNEELFNSEQLPLMSKTGQHEVLKLKVPIGEGIESGLMVQVTVRTQDGFVCSTFTILP